MAEIIKDERRVVTIAKPDFSDMEKFINEIPYNHDGAHIELFYNLIFSEQDITLPDHLRPVAWVLGDKNIDAAMLIISPGAGKSFLTDVAFPCFEIGYDPTTSIMGVSSGADLMVDFLQTSMNIIEENPIYKLLFPNVTPDMNTGWSTSRGIFVKRPATGQVSPSYQATGYGCYDDQTEVLTKEGWLPWTIITGEEEFATRNPITHEFEWQQATEHFVYDYDGEMFHLNGLSLDVLVTSNHGILIHDSHYTTGKERIITAEEVFKLGKESARIPAQSIWKGTEIKTKIFGEAGEKRLKYQERKNQIIQKQKEGFSLRKIGKLFGLSCAQIFKITKNRTNYIDSHGFGRDITMSGDDYCAFMGMYLSEGHTNKTQVCITQFKKSKGWQPYKQLLDKIFEWDTYYADSNNQFILTNKALSVYLKQYGRYSQEKFVPEDIMNATPRQQKLFWNYYLLGDGWDTTTANQKGISTSSKKMADQLQELIQKMGQSASVSSKITKERKFKERIIKGGNVQYSINLLNSQYKSFNRDKQYYKGKVFCVSVPNGTLYVRRNGKSIWCGNSKKITGKHAKILIIDDIHDEENSGTADQIEKVENFYYKTLIGRQDPKGSRMLMVGRRWAEDDLYGRLKKSGDWLVMTLASIRETPELYYDVRIPAGLACVFNDFQAKETVEDIKVVYGQNTEQVGFYWNHEHTASCPPKCQGMIAKYKEALVNKKNKPAIYETVYQSNPEAVGSKIFRQEDFQDFYLPEGFELGRQSEAGLFFVSKMQFDMVLQSWDTGLTAETRNDPSCCYTIGIKSCGAFHRGEDQDEKNTLDEMPFHYDIYVLDEWYGRLEIGDLEREAVNYFNLWNPNEVLVENSIAGIPLIQNLSQYSISVQPVKVQNVSKKNRAINGANAGSAQGWSRAGRIFIPRNAPWANELLKELDDFSGAKGKRDDRVDALVQAVNFSIDFGVLNRELPPGWRTEEELQARMQSIMAPNHPFMQIPYMLDNQVNPFYGYCGTCKMFNKETSTCKLHKRKVTKLDSCYAYDPAIDAKMRIK